ncbi:MFS transporter [Paenibacillus thalictri]|uniref:MFS transporter n=1 Tax=Paenibacillus thalictri TaxID=2527873 RepID=A0A4Q9DSQ5_9BACL|nr:MFS transporter [Paenibacillus thalictri]TBL79924.1 MFS transporter [Paenibacillus thalictri]
MTITQPIKRVLLMNAASMIIFNYIGIFVNLYIWEQGKRIMDVTWFNLVLFVVWSLAFALGARLLSVFTTRFLIRTVAISGCLTFLLLSFLHLDSRMLWIAIIAVPVGLMWGFYASTQNITLCIFGKGKDFEGYFSVATIIGQVVSIVNPVAFAFVIKWIGYSGSFLLMFVFVIGLLIVSFTIPPITLAKEPEPLFNQKMKFSHVFSYPGLRWMVPSCLSAGVFLQFQGLFAIIFTFSVSGDKLVIALLNVLYALSSIGSMILYRKLQQVRSGVWLAVGMTAICGGFLFALLQYPLFLVVSNILTTIGLFYFGTVWNTGQFRVMSKHTAMEQTRILLWREWFLNIPRIVVLILAMFVEDFHTFPFYALMGFAILCALAVPLFSARNVDAPEKMTESA